MLYFLLSVLATHRIVSGLLVESGPYGSLDGLRSFAKKNNWTVFDCVFCLSFWVAGIVSAYVCMQTQDWFAFPLYVFACSGGSVVLDQVIYGSSFPEAPQLIEDPEVIQEDG